MHKTTVSCEGGGGGIRLKKLVDIMAKKVRLKLPSAPPPLLVTAIEVMMYEANPNIHAVILEHYSFM